MQALISVVIPTYNRAEDLHRALQSVINQTYANWEVCVVDNNSTDSTDEVALSFNDPRIRLFKIDNKGVIAASRNFGIRNAKADYIAFLDSDDWWLPHKLQKSMELFSSGVDVVYHNLYLVESKEQASFSRQTGATGVAGSIMNALLSRGLSIPNSSAMVRASIIRSAGFLSEDPNLVSVEDLDLWLRISKITNNFKCATECLGYYWVGGGNLSSASWKQVKKIQYLYSLHLSSLNKDLRFEANSFLHYRIARIAINMGRMRFASQYFRLALKGNLFWKYRIKSVYFLCRLSCERRLKFGCS
ncbi:glycosyltransferase family 2 protein [Polynucleobacter paneuropaeus]|jgi:glycosyltransferase involved in cell wall biosynthesis|uniref:glycosyltransferase family 2 protein n=1 Tax=Polynucleobacter paneuropaeus TaxID=2527775 RepID=UPI001BFE3D30|nr:glycosyltransferase family 2 protein [Polynucleobacter paneuropaeus]MBT8633216.1 glycosyltransferase family 2 protein [Polynucleobacter paneuropaeus]